jgi:hypothetical protein
VADGKFWGAVAAIGSLLAGATTFFGVFQDRFFGGGQQAQPLAAATAPAGATTPPQAPAGAPATGPAPAPQQAPPQQQPAVQQANLSAADHAQLQQLVVGFMDGIQGQYGGGLVPAGYGDELVSLQPGTSYNWAVNLASGRSYRVLGACDNECSNVDLELIDASGAVVAGDTLPDDYPVFDFTPPATGAYRVRISMRACTVAPCYAGARILTTP